MTTPKNRGSQHNAASDSLDENLRRTLIAIPLMNEMDAQSKKDENATFSVIIDTNLGFCEGRTAAREIIKERISDLAGPESLDSIKNEISKQYVFASLTRSQILSLARDDLTRSGEVSRSELRTMHKIWYDHPITLQTCKSVSTVKADAARVTFGTLGSDVVWAVLDTGVDGSHPHFATHGTLDLPQPLRHLDFTNGGCETEDGRSTALVDLEGHGTHVAGIIAGEFVAGERHTLGRENEVETCLNVIRKKVGRLQEEHEADEQVIEERDGSMCGMAARAKILSLKVVEADLKGSVSNIIVALEHIQSLNDYGRHIKVHGVNLSVGYGFEPTWFACGQSPVCVEVNRTVASGAVVVTAAGNTGYGYNQLEVSGPRAAGLDITINDPGNAEDAITVGSTHRESPHIYGVSYFSSKGPTGDGRLKPDLVAPGERILSCASSGNSDRPVEGERDENGARRVISTYSEKSGTSMAAPHVSGVIAAFLSVRREFIGRPRKVKEIFMQTATDLGRERYFQGAGLVDLMRAIQSV